MLIHDMKRQETLHRFYLDKLRHHQKQITLILSCKRSSSEPFYMHEGSAGLW